MVAFKYALLFNASQALARQRRPLPALPQQR